jgi:hypothetical protein
MHRLIYHLEPDVGALLSLQCFFLPVYSVILDWIVKLQTVVRLESGFALIVMTAKMYISANALLDLPGNFVRAFSVHNCIISAIYLAMECQRMRITLRQHTDNIKPKLVVWCEVEMSS